ncbi:MAG: ATP-binding protein [Betaproteobacteria bacterium]
MQHRADSDLLYEEAACGLLVTESDGKIVRVNRTFCNWIGKPADALIGLRLQSLLSIGSRMFHQTHWSPLLKMQGSLSEVKLEIVHADGSRVPMVLNAVVRPIDGAEYHELAVFSARDRHQYERELLVAREKAEQHLERELASQRELADARARLELAIGAAQLFPWTVDLPDRRRTYGAEVARLLGHAEAGPVAAGDFLSRMHPDDRAAEAAALEKFLDEGQGRFEFTFRLSGVDGVLRWITAWGQLRRGASDAPIDLVGVLQDVTDSHRQRALAEDRALLAEQTLGIVGHDLRNPLAAIQMSADAIALGMLNADQHRSVAARIQSSTRRANRLIADLLDFTQARIGRGLRLDKKPLDAHALAADVTSELATAHPRRRLRHASAGDGACLVDGDRLIQALGNLVSNALTYGLPDTDVTLSSIGLADTVRFEVHNAGPAIDPALRPALFEPMTRGSDPGQLRSVGLGLYIVREIAHAHGGRVDCVSEPGLGTTFVICVPR